MFLLRIMPIYEEPLLSGQPPLLSGHLPVPRGILVPVTYCFLFPSPLTGSPEEYHQEAPSPSNLHNSNLHSTPFLETIFSFQPFRLSLFRLNIFSSDLLNRTKIFSPGSNVSLDPSLPKWLFSFFPLLFFSIPILSVVTSAVK